MLAFIPKTEIVFIMGLMQSVWPTAFLAKPSLFSLKGLHSGVPRIPPEACSRTTPAAAQESLCMQPGCETQASLMSCLCQPHSAALHMFHKWESLAGSPINTRCSPCCAACAGCVATTPSSPSAQTQSSSRLRTTGMPSREPRGPGGRLLLAAWTNSAFTHLPGRDQLVWMHNHRNWAQTFSTRTFERDDLLCIS